MTHYVDDPWAMSDNDVDIAMAGETQSMDESEDEHVRTVPHLHSSPGWITQQKRQAFLYGCPDTDHQAKAQAYQARDRELGTGRAANWDRGLGQGTGTWNLGRQLGAANWRQGTWDRDGWGEGTGDRELGAGNWGRELGNWRAGNWGQQTGDRELGTGNWGQGTGGRELELGTEN